MTYDDQVKRNRSWASFGSSALPVCFLASCAVYDASLLPGSAGASNLASDRRSDIGTSRGGSAAEGGGRGGTAPTTALDSGGTLSHVEPGGTNTGGSGAMGSHDGGAADAGAGTESDGSAAAGSADGGRDTGGSGGGSAAAAGTGGTSGTAGSGGTAAIVTNLSLNQPATASTQQSGYAPASGNDGDSATRWCASSATFPQWWRVDLGAIHSLNDFRISFEYPDRNYYFDIETSADDAVYTRQVSTSGSAAPQSGSFPAGVSARYVRITITNADAGVSPTWASFFEFVVTGT
jgi:hypothetical protein